MNTLIEFFINLALTLGIIGAIVGLVVLLGSIILIIKIVWGD